MTALTTTTIHSEDDINVGTNFLASLFHRHFTQNMIVTEKGQDIIWVIRIHCLRRMDVRGFIYRGYLHKIP